jgi:cytochrome c biogenesis protein CcmG/thiol:disulfide interchange protein DsbE
MATPVARPKEDQPSALAIGALVVALVAGFAALPRLFPTSESALKGKLAPDVSFSLVANAPAEGVDLSSLSKLRGHPVLIDFWATWCGPCQMEVPIVDRIAKRYGAQGLTVVGMNTSDEAGNAASYAKHHHLTFPIAYDEGQHAAAAYGVESLPTLVLISKTGQVISVHRGIASDEELDELVKRAL